MVHLIWNVFVLHKNEGGIGKSIPDAREGNLEFWWSTDYGHSLTINLSTGSGSGNPSLWAGSLLQGRIDSVKINPSLLMRECSVTGILTPSLN